MARNFQVGDEVIYEIINNHDVGKKNRRVTFCYGIVREVLDRTCRISLTNGSSTAVILARKDKLTLSSEMKLCAH